jgi:hypothetical protein
LLTELPPGWKVTSFRSHDDPAQLWISVQAPGLGSFTKLCTKDNERRMALALQQHAGGVSGSANQTFSQAHADATAKAFEIADQAMYEQLESEGVLSSADVGRIGLADDVGLEVPTLALAGRAIRDAVAWLQPRGYVSIASDAHGEYVLVLRVPGETDVDEAEVPA